MVESEVTALIIIILRDRDLDGRRMELNAYRNDAEKNCP